MANIIVITGPMAVGKMTVAEALKEEIGYNMMVNHDSIEVSDKIFGFGTPAQRELNMIIRKNVFDTTIKYNESLIFTVATDFNSPEEIDYYKNLKKKFENSGGSFYFVELSASLDERLKRNITPNRLEKKKSKQDIEWSNKDVISSETKYKLNTNENEYLFENHLKINNKNLLPEEVAKIIIEKFNLSKEEKISSEHENKMY